MLCASVAITFAVMLFLAVPSSVNMPTAVPSVLMRTITSVVVQTLVFPPVSVLAQTSVPAFGYTLALPLPVGNLLMSLDPSAPTSRMVLYSETIHGTVHIWGGLGIVVMSEA